MSDSNIGDEIREFIVTAFLYGQDQQNLEGGASLVRKGIVDSSGVLEIVSFLTQRFSIGIEDDEITSDNLDSIDRITSFVTAKLRG
jgi:acyl carrier protein